jgi:hypothetical protein
MFPAKQTPLGLLANGQETEVVPTAPPGVQPRWLPQRRQSATPATCGFIDGSPSKLPCKAQWMGVIRVPSINARFGSKHRQLRGWECMRRDRIVHWLLREHQLLQQDTHNML